MMSDMATVFQKCKHQKEDPCTQTRCGHPWTVRYREPGGRTARQREKSLPRKREADAFASKVEDQKNEGTYKDPERGRVTVRAWADEWLANQIVSPSTQEAYESFIRVYLVPYLGNKTLANVTTRDIQSFVSALHQGYNGNDPLAPSTIQARMTTLGGLFNDAVRDGRISSSPCQGVTIPRSSSQRADLDTIPNVSEVEQIASALPGRFQLAVWLMTGAGLRVSEAMAVSEDCKRDGVLRIRWQTGKVSDDAGGSRVGLIPLKARAEGDFRDIPLPPFLSDAIDDHVDTYGLHTIHGNKGLYFSSERGCIVSGYNFRSKWNRTVRGDLGMSYTPHDLRHLFASTALAGGVALHEVSRWLGHSSISITADIYGHLVEDAPERMRQAMQSALRG